MIVTIISAIICLGFLLSGFSIGIDPRTSIYLAVFSMTFPAWIIIMLLWSVVVALTRNKRSMLLMLVVWIIGAYNVVSFSPFNLNSEPENQEKSLKVMTYNVFLFKPAPEDSLLTYNATVQSIIESNADIVALQESVPIRGAIASLRITQSQSDSLRMLYPYRSFGINGLSLLSKYPFVEMELKERPTGSTTFKAYRLQLPNGEEIALFNIHLQSFRFNKDERHTYYELTDGEMSRALLSEARNELVPKVKNVLIAHASEAEMLVEDINISWPDGPLILCGDFNDILGSYPMKILCRECRLKDAFRDGAFGPTYTYHGSRFYFNIDHILYRGLDKPYITKRLKVPSSDHYPLISIFPIESH